MKDQEVSERSFLDLRHAGIAAAQAASGNIWTDYNIHDPGVTLLEQTCFAFTEASFRAAHAVPDLLTDLEGALPYDELGLFLPKRVLPGDPVTLLDLAAELAEDPAVARALVTPGVRVGLIDVLVTPSQTAPGSTEVARCRAAEAAIRARFAAKRPLCCDLGRVQPAMRQPKRLEGVVQITATANPDKVAAELYYRVAAIQRGVPVGREITAEATRRMVYDRPQTYLHAPSDQDGMMPELEDHLTALRDIPGVRDVSVLTLVDEARPWPDGTEESPEPEETLDETEAETQEYYRDLSLPTPDEELGLHLEVAGVPVALDARRIAEEHIRIAADAIARARHHLDAKDWQEPPAGRRRQFATGDVDALLPAVYASAARQSRSADAMHIYRRIANAHVQGLNNDLAEIPALFSLKDRAVPTNPAAQRRRVEVLDYQLALQGETMPATGHAALHTYRSAAERYAFEVDWRQSFLERLPEINAARGSGPSKSAPGGFMTKFLALADQEKGRFPELPPTLKWLGTEFVADAPLPEPSFPVGDVVLPEDPYEMLVSRNPNAARTSGAKLRDSFEWLASSRVPASFLQKLADPRNFIVSKLKQDAEDEPSETDDARFVVLFSAAEGSDLYTCGAFETHAQAHRYANALRETWAGLQRRAEGAVLVEDILLRDAPTHYTPNLAYMVMPGWTARACQRPYQAYIEDLILQLAPAHLHVRPIWLDFAEAKRFAALYSDFVARKAGAGPALRSFLTVGARADG